MTHFKPNALLSKNRSGSVSYKRVELLAAPKTLFFKVRNQEAEEPRSGALFTRPLNQKAWKPKFIPDFPYANFMNFMAEIKKLRAGKHSLMRAEKHEKSWELTMVACL